MEDKKTVGQASLDLLNKDPDTQDPIELQRAIDHDYEEQIVICAERGKKLYEGDFYIVVGIKRERLLKNVIRRQIFHRSTCPTPQNDQTVYKYHKNGDRIEFLWVIPSLDTCMTFVNDAHNVAPEEWDLLKFVLEFEDGTLLKKAKKLNNELTDESYIIKIEGN